jgi:hypothetical protein
VEIISSGQGCAGAFLFLSFLYIHMQKVGETTSVPFIHIAAVAVGVRFEPGSLSPGHITSNFECRTPDNPKLKGFLGTHLNRKLFNWPASPQDFSRLTLAGLNYPPELDVAWAEHIRTDTK